MSTAAGDRAHRAAELLEPGAAARATWRLPWVGINAIQLLYTLLWSAGCISLALLVRALSRRPAPALALARRLWAPGLLLGAGARLTVRGRERLPDGPAFFVANHQSMIDIPALFRALPADLHFMVKRELRHIPFLGWYIAATGMIFVDRRARGGAMAELRRAAARLGEGGSIVSFAEGTRSRDGAIGAFKSAAFLAAIEAGAPVVPVAIAGAREVLPPGGFRVRPGEIRVVVGDPLPTAGLTPEDRGRVAQEAWRRVVELHRAASAGRAAAAPS